MRFVDVHHDMFNGPDGNNYLGASCTFIHDFYLHIVALNLTLNSKMHSSEYNSKSLEDSLKAEYYFGFTKNEVTVVSNTSNDSTMVEEYFSEDAEQVNCEINYINSAIKYGFGLLEIQDEVFLLMITVFKLS